MNEYTFEQITVGQQASFEAVITPERLAMFCQISGDQNPLHCDEAYAKNAGYSGRVAYGMLTASFYSTLAGMYLPGKYSLLQTVDVSFLKPVMVGDAITVCGIVTEKNETFRMISVKAQIFNQNHEKVSRAKLQIGFHVR